MHDQFAQKHPIPANGGKTIQFRRFAPLGKALTALTEGVTPDGQSLSMSTVETAVRQYGGYIQMSDLLLLTAIDNNLTMATKLLGAQAGRTLDTITREVLVGGDNVQYADESVSARYLLRGGNAGAADNNYLTVDCIRRAVRALKNANCRRIDGAFPVIIHPDVAYDLMNDPNGSRRTSTWTRSICTRARSARSRDAASLRARRRRSSTPKIWPPTAARCSQTAQ